MGKRISSSSTRASQRNPIVVLANRESSTLESMGKLATSWGYDVRCASDLAQLTACLIDVPADLVLMDVLFDEEHGQAFSRLLLELPCPPVVVLTAMNCADSATFDGRTLHADGAKQADLHHLKRVAEHAIRQRRTNHDGEIPEVRPKGAKSVATRSILGESRAIAKVREMIADIAVTDAKVLILGESGTGKELVARAIHDQSRRASCVFAPVNMAALPHSLAESVLFGHEKGAFTDANSLQRGWCEMADKGTLFLDEIGEMDLALQAKLLRFLQDGSYQRIGSSKVCQVDVRIIAATNRDPLTLVRDGRLREDLYYRLNVLPVVVPPLRDRREDIEMLAQTFRERSASTHGKQVHDFTPAALEMIVAYDWPGNIRQLENTVERLVILARAGEIGVEDLPTEIIGGTPVNQSTGTIPAPAAPARFEMRDIEKEAILKTLVQTGGNVVRAAHLLGLGQATVYRKMKRFGIRVERKQRRVCENGGSTEAGDPSQLGDGAICSVRGNPPESSSE